MKIAIEGDLKEIADLAMEVQSQLNEKIMNERYDDGNGNVYVRLPIEMFRFIDDEKQSEFNNLKNTSIIKAVEYIEEIMRYRVMSLD